MPAGLMLRSRTRFHFLTDAAVLNLTRSGLAASGLAVARVTARAVEPVPGAAYRVLTPRGFASEKVEIETQPYDIHSILLWLLLFHLFQFFLHHHFLLLLG